MDSPILGLSAQDVGSGVLAFVTTAVVLGLLTDRGEPAWRVVTGAGMVGLITIVVDLLG